MLGVFDHISLSKAYIPTRSRTAAPSIPTARSLQTKRRSTSSGFGLVVTSHALNHTYDSLLPILYPPMISEFNLSYSLVGMMVMGYRISSGLLQLMMGFLGRFVRRKILLGLGMIWQCMVNSLVSFSHGFEQILISRTLAGVGASPQHPTGSSYITETFPRTKLGKALGLNIAAAQVGNFATPFVGSLLLSILGWRMTILAFSVPGLLVGTAFLFVNEPKRSRQWSGASSLQLLFTGVRDVLRNRTVVAVLVLETVMAFRIGARDFLPSYFSNQLGMTTLEVGVIFAIFVGSGIPAPYIWGHLSDRFQRTKVVMLAMGASAALWYLLPSGKTAVQLLAILVPLGFASQGVGGVIQAYVADATSQENRDIIYGIYFTLAFTLGSLSPVIQGFLTDTYGFETSFTYVAAVSLLAVIASVFLK